MAAFHYQALNKIGQNRKGVIEADSERHARQLLRESGLVPVNIYSLKNRIKTNTKKKISAADLSLFTRQLATLLGAGIPVEEALQGVSEQTEKEKVREVIISVRSKVLEGFSLAQAFQEFPQAFPELYAATVGAGEQTGRLDVVLEKLADYTENQQATKNKIQQALIYPSLMIVVSVSIISFLLTFVVPKIIDVFTNTGQSLPKMTQLLLFISAFIKAYGLVILGLFFIIFLIMKRSLKNKTLRERWHQFLLKIPILAYLIRTTNVSRYIHTFSILFAAGVSVLETMRVSSSLMGNLKLYKAFSLASVRVKEGIPISQALKDTLFLTPMAIHLIASGEKSGQISLMMEKTARHLDDEVKRLIDTALGLLEPFIILLMGIVVLFIVLATLLPIFSMEQLVG